MRSLNAAGLLPVEGCDFAAMYECLRGGNVTHWSHCRVDGCRSVSGGVEYKPVDVSPVVSGCLDSGVSRY